MQKATVILGGGAALGFAHIGALKEIEKKFEIQRIIGTSMGSLIGGLYAYGMSPDEILEFGKDFKYIDFINPLNIDLKFQGDDGIVVGMDSDEIKLICGNCLQKDICKDECLLYELSVDDFKNTKCKKFGHFDSMDGGCDYCYHDNNELFEKCLKCSRQTQERRKE